MANGALVGVLRHRLRLPAPPVAQGITYALLVYAASYAGWVAALGIMRDPEVDCSDRQAMLVATHIMYGTTLGMLLDAVPAMAIQPFIRTYNRP